MQSTLAGNETANEIKTQLLTREGVYRLASQSEYGRPKCSPYTPQTNAPNTNSSSLPLVHISFSKFATNTTNYQNRTSTHIVHYPHHHRISSYDETNNSRLTLSSEHKFNGNSNHSHETSAEDNESDILCSFYQNTNVLHEDQIQERICFNIGRELFIFIFNGLQPSDPSKLVDRKTYKSTSPTCHDFCTNIEQRISLLLIGFSHGQIQLIDPYRTEINKFYNQERLIDKSKVTCIRWLPRSKTNFLVAYSSGQMYLYKEDLPCFTTTPTYQQFKTGDGFTIYTCKTKSTRNPLYRWSIGNNNDNGSNTSLNGIQTTQSAINEFAFSPCGQYLAIVSQDGFLRVFNYDQMELIGLMRSYFGGLLCVGWSPDSKFLVTGGEDDLITVWSLQDRRVIARGQGHKSWINSVTFDPFMTKTKDDQEDNYANLQHSDIDNDSTDETNNSNSNHTCKSKNNEFKLLTNYRIGSVGQDTQICLWDLTDDIIRQSSVIKSRSRSTITNASIGTSSNNKDNNEYKTPKMLNNLITGNVANSTGNQLLSTSNNFFSLKKSGHKKGFLSSRSFLDHGKSNKNVNSISSAVNKNDFSNYIPPFSNSVFSDNFFNATSNVCDSSRLLGTILCPRLKEVPMLEPHICKKISNERLTSLVFRKDYFVVANHDGKIIIFARPNKLNKNLKISSPNASMASDVNDINNLSTIGGGDDEDESEPIRS